MVLKVSSMALIQKILGKSLGQIFCNICISIDLLCYDLCRYYYNFYDSVFGGMKCIMCCLWQIKD